MKLPIMNHDRSHLILKLVDGEIDQEQLDALEQELINDPELRVLYTDHILTEHCLEKILGQSQLLPQNLTTSTPNHFHRKNIWLSTLTAVACLIIGLIVTRFIAYDETQPSVSLRFCENSLWSINGNNKSSSESTTLTVGSRLEIKRGAVEIHFDKGVKAIIRGPANLYVKNPSTLVFGQGEGRFNVPKEAIGFTVLTPRLQVIDLGTEFTIITDEHGQDEVHVIQGAVEVNSLQRSHPFSKKLVAGDAIAATNQTPPHSIKFKAYDLLKKLPRSIKVILHDDMEHLQLTDNEVINITPHGWEKIGHSIVGTFNPDPNKRWYTHPDLEDSIGTIGAMNGPSMAYIWNAKKGDGISHSLKNLNTNCYYSVSLAIGHRPKHLDQSFGGYTIALMSGSTILKQISSNKAPGQENSVSRIHFKWDAQNRPQHIGSDAPLSLRITVNGQGNPARSRCYLDIDDVRVTEFEKLK